MTQSPQPTPHPQWERPPVPGRNASREVRIPIGSQWIYGDLVLQRRERRYRGDHPAISPRGRHVILVDDGLATGATMRAAVLAVRQHAPARLIVAVPVGARDSCEALADVADEVVCPFMPEPFQAVGLWYDPMTQASDEEVCEILNRARTERSLAIRQSAQTGSPAPSR